MADDDEIVLSDEQLRERERRTAMIARIAGPIAAGLIDGNRALFEPDELAVAKQSARIAAYIIDAAAKL